MEKKIKSLKVFSIIFLIIAAFFFYQAYDKKNNYQNPNDENISSSSDQTKNAYVGGDAYNYIINSNYFIGYLILGCFTFSIAFLSYIASLLIELKVENIEMLKMKNDKVDKDQLPEI